MQIGGPTLNNYRIKNISENSISNSNNELEKQIELIFEASGKTDKIQLTGTGALKVSAPV